MRKAYYYKIGLNYHTDQIEYRFLYIEIIFQTNLQNKYDE